MNISMIYINCSIATDIYIKHLIEKVNEYACITQNVMA